MAKGYQYKFDSAQVFCANCLHGLGELAESAGEQNFTKTDFLQIVKGSNSYTIHCGDCGKCIEHDFAYCAYAQYC